MGSIIPLKEANQHKPQHVGHAARKLSELFQAGLYVQDGVVLSSRMFKEYLIESGIKERFFSLLRSKEIEALQKLIHDQPMPKHMSEELLNEVHGLKNKGFSVRVSTVFSEEYDARNLPEEKLEEGIRKSWASIFTQDRAKHFNNYNMFPSVIIQPAVHETKYGQMFMLNPLTNSKEKMIVEVQSPKHYFFLVNKGDHSVVNEKDFFTISSPLFIEEKGKLCLMAAKVDKYFAKPQKIRWIMGKEPYLVSSEDITYDDKQYFMKLANKQDPLKINLKKAVAKAVEKAAGLGE